MMAVYMVERSLPGITNEQLAGAQGAAIAGAQQSTAAGTPVRYIRSTFVPDESRCLCLFEAGSEQAVRAVNDSAGLPFTRIVEALDLTPAK
jgi:hypothetical protein